MNQEFEVLTLDWASRLAAARPAPRQRSILPRVEHVDDDEGEAEQQPQADDMEEFAGRSNPFAQLEVISTNDNPNNNNQGKEIFETVPLKSRKRARRALGKPGSRERCFGCVYLGERDTGIPSKDLQLLIDIQRNCAACSDLTPMVKAMAEQYEIFRTKINASLYEGETPLPPWPAAMILDHLENHTLDPEVQKVMVLKEVQELRWEAANLCIEKSKTTGRKRINKSGVDAYEKLVKLQFYLQKLKPEEMDYYSGGSRINPSSTKQGLIATGTKKLIRYWE